MMTFRDANADDLLDSLDFDRLPAFLEPPALADPTVPGDCTPGAPRSRRLLGLTSPPVWTKRVAPDRRCVVRHIVAVLIVCSVVLGGPVVARAKCGARPGDAAEVAATEAAVVAACPCCGGRRAVAA